MAKRVDLQQQPNFEALLLAQFDEAVENGLPVPVAGEIVVGDEKAGDALCGVGAHDRLDVVRGPITGLASLNVDDRAEAALERAAAPRVEAGVVSRHPGHDRARQDWNRRRGHVRHVVEVTVQRLCDAGVDVLDEISQAAFAFPCIQDHPERLRFPQLRRLFRQHGDAPGDMEAANRDRHAERPKLAADVERPGKLIGLNANQRDESAAGLDPPGNCRDVDDRVALVQGFDLDIHVGAENAIFRAFRKQAVDAGEAVRGDRRPPPLDDVAVAIVMRGLDQNDCKPAPGHGPSSKVNHSYPVFSSSYRLRGASATAIRWTRAFEPLTPS